MKKNRKINSKRFEKFMNNPTEYEWSLKNKFNIGSTLPFLVILPSSIISYLTLNDHLLAFPAIMIGSAVALSVSSVKIMDTETKLYEELEEMKKEKDDLDELNNKEVQKSVDKTFSQLFSTQEEDNEVLSNKEDSDDREYSDKAESTVKNLTNMSAL